MAAKITRQDRDTYLECDISPGIFYLYVDMEWQPDTYRWLKHKLEFSMNCYGVGDVRFSQNLAEEYDQCEVLDHVMMCYSIATIENGGAEVKMGKSDFEEVEIFEEENYWNAGYNFKVAKNNSQDKVFIMSHTNLDFKNGLMIKPCQLQDDYRVSRSQYSFMVKPGEYRGVYTKPYTGYSRGGQANTQKLVDADSVEEVVIPYFEEHH